MFHTILVKIKKIAAISIPIGLLLNRVMKKAIAAGKKPSIGTDWRISTIGMMILDAILFLAAVIPTANATTNEIANAANILKTEKIESIINAEGSIFQPRLDLFARTMVSTERDTQPTIKTNVLLRMFNIFSLTDFYLIDLSTKIFRLDTGYPILLMSYFGANSSELIVL